MKIEVAQAMHGDCLWIDWLDINNQEHNLLIDSGVFNTYTTYLNNKFKTTNCLDAIILTHIDEDHIGGFLKYIKNRDSSITIRNYFINNPELVYHTCQTNKKSISQAHNILSALKELNEINKCYPLSISNHSKLSFLEGLQFEIISPDEKRLENLNKKWLEQITKQIKNESLKKCVDKQGYTVIAMEELAKLDDCVQSDITNDCSIAFVLKDRVNSALFLGDSNPNIIVENLKTKGYSSSNKLNVDFVKLSHHGSRHNISKELISLIDSPNFIICTNGGKGDSKHPDRETIAKIVCSPGRNKSISITFWFNYPKEQIEKKNGLICSAVEEHEYNFRCENIKKGSSLQ